MRAPILAVGMFAATTRIAHAHPGEHAHLPLVALAQHLTEPDHLALIALAAIVGVVAYRWSQRTLVRVRTPARKSRGDRS